MTDVKTAIKFFFALMTIGTAAWADSAPVKAAAERNIPGLTWQADSVLTGDFSCEGREQYAILGTNPSDIVIAVFLKGLDSKPEILHYSTKARRPADVKIKTESMDFKLDELKDEIGAIPEGMHTSKTCKGLNLSDDRTDSAHIYWNHVKHEFDDWGL